MISRMKDGGWESWVNFPLTDMPILCSQLTVCHQLVSASKPVFIHCNILQEEDLRQRMIFIPLLVGLVIAFSLGATRTAKPALIHTYHSISNFQDKIDKVMTSTMDSLQFLQQQTTSLVGFEFPNWRALDLITAEHKWLAFCWGRNAVSMLMNLGL